MVQPKAPTPLDRNHEVRCRLEAIRTLADASALGVLHPSVVAVGIGGLVTVALGFLDAEAP